MEPFSHDDAPGDFWGRAVLFAGGGCLLLVLGLGLLVTYGTCQCGDSVRESMEAAERPVLDPVDAFLEAVGQGDMGGALAQMDPRARPPHTEASLRALVDSHQGLFSGGTARLLRDLGDPTDPHARFVVVQIVEGQPEPTVRGVATFWLRREPGRARPAVYTITQLDAGDQGDQLRQRQHALALVRAWLEALSLRRDARARELIHGETAQQMDHPTMVRLVDSQAGLLRAGATAQPQSWRLRGKEAELGVDLLDDQGQRLGALRCELRWTPKGWRITSFETQQEVDSP